MKRQMGQPEEIEVSTGMKGEILGFTRNGLWQRIGAIYERWHLADEWWGKEVKRHYFKIETSRGVYDIYHDLIDDRWYLDKVYD
jgi:hypothetical protein